MDHYYGAAKPEPISDDTVLLRQALGALYAAERFCGHAKFPAHDVASAITAIRTRLEKT